MKTCTSCKVTKKKSEFHKKGKWLRNPCKECRKTEAADYYVERGRELRIKRLPLTRKYMRRQRSNRRKWFYELIKDQKCVDCGFADIRALDFDHVRGKKRRMVSAMLCQGYSKESVLTEIAKCEVRCKNCHAIRTAEQQNQYKHRRLNGSNR